MFEIDVHGSVRLDNTYIRLNVQQDAHGFMYSLFHYTVEPVLSGLMTGCRWPDNKKSLMIKGDPKTTF
jgi:hypothetical protein